MRKIVLCLVMVATLATTVVFGQEAEEPKVTRTITASVQMEYLEGFAEKLNDKYNPGWNDLSTLWTQFGAKYAQNYIFGQEWLTAGINIYKNTSNRLLAAMDLNINGKVFGVDNFNLYVYLDTEVTYGFQAGYYGVNAGPVSLGFYVGGEFHGYNFNKYENQWVVAQKYDEDGKGVVAGETYLTSVKVSGYTDDWFEKVFCGISYAASFNHIFGVSGKVEYTWENAEIKGTAGGVDPGHLKIDVYLTANLGYGFSAWGGMRFYLIERNILDPRAGINYTLKL